MYASMFLFLPDDPNRVDSHVGLFCSLVYENKYV